MFADLKFAFRSLLRSSGFTALVVLILGLCIGANTAVFTVLKKVVLDPLPFAEPGQLVAFHNTYPKLGRTEGASNGVSDYLNRKELKDVFESVAAWTEAGYESGMTGAPRRIPGNSVSPEYFRTLGVVPFLGRDFTDEESAPGRTTIAILSFGLWQELFAGDPGAIGKEIRVNGLPNRVIGVMPRAFTNPFDPKSRIWKPLMMFPNAAEGPPFLSGCHLIGRLRPGVTVALAQEQVDAQNRAIAASSTEMRQLITETGLHPVVVGLKKDLLGEAGRRLFLIQTAALLVLVIGCVNVASLMLLRSESRRTELAVRCALGAGRGVLARQVLAESLVLTVIGAMFGLVVAATGIQVLGAWAATELPQAAGIALDGTALAVNFAVTMATGVIFAALPIRALLRQDLGRLLISPERSGTAERGALRMRSMLVLLQIAFAFILLAGAGLLVSSFWRLLDVNPGFSTQKVLTGQMVLPWARYRDEPLLVHFVSQLTGNLEALPQIEAAAIVTDLPFSGGDDSAFVKIGGGMRNDANAFLPRSTAVSSGYFDVMRIPLLQGRRFADTDDAEGLAVAVIDETLARKHWPKGDVVGKTLAVRDTMRTVIGVVGSVKHASLTERDEAGQIYLPYPQLTVRPFYLVLRGTGSEAMLSAAVRRLIARLDPQLAVADVKSLDARVAASLSQTRAAMVLCCFFGALAALLAAVGIYGVVAYSATERSREFGVRLALGAQADHLLRSVLLQGLRIAGIGVAIGAVAALASTRFLGSFLYGVQPADPMTFTAIAVLLIAVTLLACYLPARRVTRIDPLIALRAE